MLIGGIFGVVCLLFTGGIVLWEQQVQKGLYDQQMAERWSKEGGAAQISAFFAEDAVEDEFYFKGIAESVEKALQEASITKENENARLWVDAVSRGGTAVLCSERAEVQVDVVGVSGEFFQFHPHKLVTGSFFSEDSMMQDGVVIDEETAWQLFGSSDVAGMQIMIGQVPHYITGVIERPQGRINKAAGWEHSVCYISLNSLQQYGTVTGGFTYEIVMPNPIKGFALAAMQNIFGNDNEDVVAVENSTRYQALPLLKVIQDFGIRSMSQKGIIYPYWENAARGYEDILALTLVVKMILLLMPCIFVVVSILYLWKKKTWNLEQMVLWIQDKWYEAGTKRVKKNQEEKQEETE